MSTIVVDESKFVATHQQEPKPNILGLWVFSIQDRDICFWGRYPDAVSTAKLYAASRGLESGAITLVDCASAFAGTAKN